VVEPERLLITVEYVRQALDELVKTGQERINPLQYLHLVDDYTLKADFSFFQNPRQFALNEVLVSLIREHYRHLRSLFNMPAPQISVNLATATTIIQEDAAHSNPDLLGWSWLYFHYIEDSLRISQQWFCDTVKLDDRTIRRYQNNSIGQLTKQLIQLEQEAREIHHRRILTLRLPHQGSISTLFERDHELEIIRNSSSKHICISGAPGIGKSAFVEFFLQEKISNDELDKLEWIESPENIEYVRLHLQERLLVENTQITTGEYVLIRRVAIVLDDCELLLDDMPKLESFLRDFSNAYVFLISHAFQAMLDCLQINLRELSVFGATALLQQIHTDFDASENNPYVWQRVGGNPLGIHLLAQNSTIFDIQLATSITLEHVFADMYQSLQNGDRLAWLILALLNNTSTDLMDLTEFESEYVSVDNFVWLIRLSVATKTDNSRIGLTSSACRFIELCYKSTQEIQIELESFVKYLNTTELQKSDLVLPLIESLLSSNWVLISDELSAKCAKHYSRDGIRRGHFAIWHTILSRYSENIDPTNVDLAIGYGLCQRHLGQWADAQTVFAEVVKISGSVGDFEHQAEALLEWAILMRWQGNYTGATEALNHVQVLVKSNLARQINNRLESERVEITLEQNQIEDAWALVEQLHESEPRKRVLMLEICARQTVPVFTSETVQRWGLELLSHYESNSSIIARLHVLMGRISEKQNALSFAIKHRRIALSLLTDQDNDPFALARAQSNLASLFIQTDELTDAQMLLNSAKNIQRQIGDRVGLAVSMHNEHTIQRKIVS
jgi:tetratricopeptide (TPR) repeat protein